MLDRIKLSVKQIILKVTGRVSHLKKGLQCHAVWYGGEHTGFFVHPEVLNDESIVYSFGIGENISFDREIVKHHNSRIFAFDPTPKSIRWVHRQKLPSRFQFFNYGISTKSGLVEFYLPKNPNHVSGSLLAHDRIDQKEKVCVKMKSWGDITDELNHSHIDILKLDIEGAEYGVIDDILKKGISIGQILVEFHDRFLENGWRQSRLVVKKMKDAGYEIFAVSKKFEEVSFIHRSLVMT